MLNIKKYFRNDYYSGLCILFVAITWGIYLFIAITGITPTRNGLEEVGPDFKTWYSVIASVITVFLVVMTVYKLIQKTNLCSNGIEITGEIRELRTDKDRGAIVFEYAYDNRNYKKWIGIWKNQDTMRYKSGDSITLLVNSKKPKSVLIKDLYV